MLTTLKASITTGTGDNAVTKDYFFLGQEDFYTGNIATSTGIVEATNAEKSNPKFKVEELLKKGILIRLSARTDEGQYKLVCAKGKLESALTGLPGSQIDGNQVESVNIPLKATFY